MIPKKLWLDGEKMFGEKMVDTLQNATIKQMKEEGFEDPSWDEVLEWVGEHIRIVVKED